MFLKALIVLSLSIPAIFPDNPAPTPDQERELLKEVKVPEGFEATIFAVPPAVNYPVFVAAAPDGTVYVSSDKNGSLDRGPNHGRVLRVRDLNGDGHADEVKLFVPNVDSPRGLLWDRDRLYLLHPPHLSVFIDHDRDGISDEQKTLVKNIAFTFKDRPADHSSNGIEMGIDGWIYCAIGDFGFMEAEGTDGTKLQLRGGGVVRVRPDGTGLQLYSRGTRNILEACVSPLLDIFARDNTNDGDGWDIRLHHFTGLSEHGYPSLYKNFRGEFIEPLADYGGGSGCGGMYLSEPGFPAGYGEALYTADWGREWVYRHRLTAKGASFTADQNEFVRAPRVTDLDVDASSRVYVASWKGASFTYVGENVGFLLRVTPKGFTPEFLPNFEKASDEELFGLLESASHRRRLAAQRELLGRQLSSTAVMEDLVRNGSRPLAARVAALYVIALKNRPNVREFLSSLVEEPDIAEYAIRAISEHGGPADREKFSRALLSSNPRVRRESAFAIALLGDSSLAPPLSALLGDSDETVRHTAIQSLKKLSASEPCFQVLDSPGSSERERDGAAQVLQALHRRDVVEGLAMRLSDHLNSRLAFTSLARLHFKEGKWNGDSWGTRPDTSGPYYQPAAWEESLHIAALLKARLKSASGEEAVFLARALGRHKVHDPEILQTMAHLAEHDEALMSATLALLVRAEDLSPEMERFLIKAAADNLPQQIRAQAITGLSRHLNTESAPHALIALSKLHADGASGREWSQAKQAFLRSRKGSQLLEFYMAEASKLSGLSSIWADAALISLADARGDTPARSAARAILDEGWRNPTRRIQILKAIALAESRGSRQRVLDAWDDSDPKVVQAAQQTAAVLRLERDVKPKAEPQVASLSPEETLAQISEMKGDVRLGAELFVRQSCNTCHTVAQSEPLRGPFLGNIAAIYQRGELATAILQPNKTIAQGFTTQAFELTDGTEIEGFVVQESASAITVRNVLAQEITIAPKDIAKRARLEKSLMPEGLVANLTVRELASLLDYLVNLPAKQ